MSKNTLTLTRAQQAQVEALVTTAVAAVVPSIIAEVMVAYVDADAKAKVERPKTGTRKAGTKARTRKGKARKAPAKRTAQTVKTLGRKGWNSALSHAARAKGEYAPGVSVYRYAMDNWTEVQTMREQGMTPAKALEQLLG